jgi:hypothetical protein
MTDQEWEERARKFSEILVKLDEADLLELRDMFDCQPKYYEDNTKYDSIGSRWSTLRNLRRGAADAKELQAALKVLRLR